MVDNAPAILVGAGTNSAGKSSIVQPFIESAGGAYFNPDQYAHALIERGMPPSEANAMAWTRGYDRLCSAVERGSAYAFETTLGGHSIAYQVMRALALGRRVVILYVGLASPELHLQRIRERVARGGHDIPEDKVRQRYDDSRKNLLSFIGTAATIRVWDNSTQTADGRPAFAQEVFRIENRILTLPDGTDPGQVPGWVRPMLAQAIKMLTV
jgi:predicted ABC-type ATPase